MAFPRESASALSTPSMGCTTSLVRKIEELNRIAVLIFGDMSCKSSGTELGRAISGGGDSDPPRRLYAMRSLLSWGAVRKGQSQAEDFDFSILGFMATEVLN